MGNIGRQLALVRNWSHLIRSGGLRESGPERRVSVSDGFSSSCVCFVQYEYKFIQEKSHQD